MSIFTSDSMAANLPSTENSSAAICSEQNYWLTFAPFGKRPKRSAPLSARQSLLTSP